MNLIFHTMECGFYWLGKNNHIQRHRTYSFTFRDKITGGQFINLSKNLRFLPTSCTIQASTGHRTQYRPLQDTLHNKGQYRTPYIQARTGHLTQYRPVQDTWHNTGHYRTPCIQASTGHLHNTGQYRTPDPIQTSTGRLAQYRPGHLTQYRPLQDTLHNTG